MNDDLIKRLRAAADAVMDYQWSGDRERMAALHELCQAESAAADALEAQAVRIAELEAALHEIAEEWAGAECGEPVHAQEAYAIGLAKRMYSLAAAALKEKQ
jgi:hypothetical protein